MKRIQFPLRSLFIFSIYLGALGTVLTLHVRARVRHDELRLVLHTLHHLAAQPALLQANGNTVPQTEQSFCRVYSRTQNTNIHSFRDLDSRIQTHNIRVNWTGGNSVWATISDGNTLYVLYANGEIVTHQQL